MSEVKFAGTVVKIDDVVVAKITSFNRSLSISEDEVTGSEDTVEGKDVLRQKFASISVGETASLEGVAISGDAGQSALSDAAEGGETVELDHIRRDGKGYSLAGFFTSYEESGDTSGVYRFSGSFRVNSKTEIEGS